MLLKRQTFFFYLVLSRFRRHTKNKHLEKLISINYYEIIIVKLVLLFYELLVLYLNVFKHKITNNSINSNYASNHMTQKLPIVFRKNEQKNDVIFFSKIMPRKRFPFVCAILNFSVTNLRNN